MAARRAAVGRMTTLCEWAADGQLWLQRARLAQAILELDPDHVKARLWLKYERGADGRWRAPVAWTEPKDIPNAKALPEFVERRAAVAAEFRNRLFEAIDREGGSLPLLERERAIEDVLIVGPDDPVAREASGEVRRGSGWILRETMDARARRAALVTAAYAALAAVAEPARVEILPAEAALKGGFDAAVATPDFRVLGLHATAELPGAARTAQAAIALFATSFRQDPAGLPGFTFLVFSNPAKGTAFIARSKAFREDQRALALRCSSFWIPAAEQVLVYANAPEVRQEWAARQPVAEFLRRRFAVTLKQGWAHEGFGIYLSELLTGQHRTYFVRMSEYGAPADPLAAEFWKRLRAPETDWMAEAKAVLLRWPRGDLRLLLGKDVNVMKGDDLVVSYALAALLLEGRPAETPQLLEAIGRETPLDDAVAGALHMTVDSLEIRLRRFLAERKKP